MRVSAGDLCAYTEETSAASAEGCDWPRSCWPQSVSPTLHLRQQTQLTLLCSVGTFFPVLLAAGQLERVVTPPCINLAPTGAPSSSPSIATQPASARSSSGGGSKQHRGGSATKGGRGPGSKGGVGMKSCESFVVSPVADTPLVAFLGDNGHIGLVSLVSRTSVGSLKMNGSARAAAFGHDGNTLVTAGGWVCGVVGLGCPRPVCRNGGEGCFWA